MSPLPSGALDGGGARSPRSPHSGAPKALRDRRAEVEALAAPELAARPQRVGERGAEDHRRTQHGGTEGGGLEAELVGEEVELRREVAVVRATEHLAVGVAACQRAELRGFAGVAQKFARYCTDGIASTIAFTPASRSARRARSLRSVGAIFASYE